MWEYCTEVERKDAHNAGPRCVPEPQHLSGSVCAAPLLILFSLLLSLCAFIGMDPDAVAIFISIHFHLHIILARVTYQLMAGALSLRCSFIPGVVRPFI